MSEVERQLSPVSLCWTLSHSPASEPTTTSSRAPKRTFTPKRCPFSSTAADGGGDIQSGRQPRGGDPEDPELDVPGAGHDVGEPLAERDAVERVPLHSVVGGDDAHDDLNEDQSGDDEEVFQRRLLRRRQLRR